MFKIPHLLCALFAAGWALSCAGTATDPDDAAPASLHASSVPTPAARAQEADDDDADDEDDADDGDEDEDEDDDQEVEIALSEVPHVVMEAAMHALPGIVLVSAERELEQGEIVYCLHGTQHGDDVEIELSAAGDVLEIERD
jgi:hypothetical protein